MMICNDRRWPESYRVMGLQGVELILCGYNTPIHYAPDPSQDSLQGFHNALVMQAGAYQNGTWVVGVAKGGVEEGVDSLAQSMIVAPSGQIVAQALTTGDELVVARCDLDWCARYQGTVFDFDRYRRPEMYTRITSQRGRDAAVADRAVLQIRPGRDRCRLADGPRSPRSRDSDSVPLPIVMRAVFDGRSTTACSPTATRRRPRSIEDDAVWTESCTSVPPAERKATSCCGSTTACDRVLAAARLSAAWRSELSVRDGLLPRRSGDYRVPDLRRRAGLTAAPATRHRARRARDRDPRSPGDESIGRAHRGTWLGGCREVLIVEPDVLAVGLVHSHRSPRSLHESDAFGRALRHRRRPGARWSRRTGGASGRSGDARR